MKFEISFAQQGEVQVASGHDNGRWPFRHNCPRQQRGDAQSARRLNHQLRPIHRKLHRIEQCIVFDAYDINGGSPLGFTNNFLTPNESATAVLVFRHKGTPYALGSAIWEKYKIGESFHILDPETKAPAVKNPWFQPKPGVLANNDAALDRLLAKGTVVGVCSISLRGQSRRLAANAGVTPEEALKEWTADLIPGATVIPSGTWGLNRAQEAGCTYCAGG